MHGNIPRVCVCVCASIAALACIFSVNRWDLPRPNGSLESETMSLSRAARSDASSKAFMALFRGSVSLFARIGNSFSFSSISSLRISHSSPHRSIPSHLSLPLPRSLSVPGSLIRTRYSRYILLYATSRYRNNSKNRNSPNVCVTIQ